FAASGLRVLGDAVAQIRLKMPLRRTDYAVYLEDVTPAEVLALLQRLAGQDRKPPRRLDGSPGLVAMAAADRHDLRDLFGHDPTGGAARNPPAPLPRDPHKPLPDQTEAHLKAALDGKGVPRPGASTRTALLLAYGPTVRSRPSSAEVKAFLAARPAPRA